MNTGYVIAVDYFIWDEEKQRESTCKHYLFTQGKHKIFVFHKELNNKDDDVVLFKTHDQAKRYIEKHDLSKSICYANCRVERVYYGEAVV